MYQLSDGQRRQTCEDSDWSDTTIQGAFITWDNDAPRSTCEKRSTELAHQRVKLTWYYYTLCFTNFYGIGDWATYLNYLTYEGKCGWQGEIQDLEKYQNLKEENRPSKMLAIADHWMRSELDRNRRSRRAEKAQGELAHALDPTDRQGGFSSGRNLQTGN